MKPPACRDCTHVEVDGDELHRRRYPPAWTARRGYATVGAGAYPPDGPVAEWPLVDGDDWCGEFRRRE